MPEAPAVIKTRCAIYVSPVLVVSSPWRLIRTWTMSVPCGANLGVGVRQNSVRATALPEEDRGQRFRMVAPAQCPPFQPIARRLKGNKQLRYQPSPRRDDHRFHARLQGGVKDRRKMRVMVGRDLVEPARCLGLGVSVGVGPADEPEH